MKPQGLSRTFVTQWTLTPDGVALPIVGVAPMNRSLMGVDLLSLVNLSALVPLLTNNATLSSPPTSSAALGLPLPSLWLCIPTYRASQLLVVVSVASLSSSVEPLPTAYESEIRLALAGDDEPDVVVLVPANPCTTKPPRSASSHGPPRPPPPPPPPRRSDVQLVAGEALVNYFRFVDQDYTVTCVPSSEAVDGASSPSLLVLVVLIPVLTAVLTSALLAASYLSHKRGASPPPPPSNPSPSTFEASPPSAFLYKDVSPPPNLNVFGFYLDKLNNPLHMILSLLAFLEESSGPSVDVELLHLIREQAKVMAAVVGDAMEVRGIEQGAAGDCAQVDVAALVVDAVENWRRQGQAKGVGVTTWVDASLPLAYGDARKLSQAVSALVSTAIHLSHMGTVALSIAPARYQGEGLTVAQVQGVAAVEGERAASSSSGSSSPQNKLRRALHVNTGRGRATSLVLSSPAASLPSPSACSPSSSSSLTDLTLCVKVRSTGCHIPRKSLASLFDPSLAPSASSPPLMGLMVVHKLMRSLGGRIEVRGSPHATTFYLIVTLSLTPPSTATYSIDPIASPVASDPVPLDDDEYLVLVDGDEGGVKVAPLPLEHAMGCGAPVVLDAGAADQAAEGEVVREANKPPADGEGGPDAEEARDDCKAELTTANLQSTSYLSLPLLSLSSHETPQPSLLLVTRQTPSPASVLSSMSSFQLYTPRPLIGRSYTEAVASTFHSLPLHSLSTTTLPSFSPSTGTVSVGPVWGSGSPPTRPSTSVLRRKSLVNELAMMTRQGAAARFKARTEGSGFDAGDAAGEEPPLSLLAGSRRLSEALLAGEAMEPATAATTCTSSSSSHSSPQQPFGRCASAPGTMGPGALLRDGGVKQLTPAPPLTTPPEETQQLSVASSAASSTEATPHLLKRSQTTVPVEAAVPTSVPAPLRVLSMPTTPSTAALPDSATLSPACSSSSLASSPSPSAASTPRLLRRARTAAGAKRSPESGRVDPLRVEAVQRLLRSRSVLVVDDTHTNLKIACSMLPAFDLVTATDGLQAVQAFKANAGIETVQDREERERRERERVASGASLHSTGRIPAAQPPHAVAPFAFILCDVSMPVMDGLDATRAIRTLEKAHGLTPIPIIAVTANSTWGDRISTSGAGMELLLAKPFNVTELYDAIEAAVQQRRDKNAAEVGADVKPEPIATSGFAEEK